MFQNKSLFLPRETNAKWQGGTYMNIPHNFIESSTKIWKSIIQQFSQERYKVVVIEYLFLRGALTS